MRKCELCENPAKIYCESDQASLCWGCDSKVHNANFLVAKHSRTLLCHVCQSPTPWTGSGPKFTPTVSVCDICVGRRRGTNDEDRSDGDDDDDDEDLDSDDGAEDDDGGGGYEDDEENQVVPGSSTSPPPVSSSSTSEESSRRFCNNKAGVSESKISFSLKRTRENEASCSQDGRHVSSSSQQTHNFFSCESASSASFRPLKSQKRTNQRRSKTILDDVSTNY